VVFLAAATSGLDVFDPDGTALYRSSLHGGVRTAGALIQYPTAKPIRVQQDVHWIVAALTATDAVSDPMRRWWRASTLRCRAAVLAPALDARVAAAGIAAARDRGELEALDTLLALTAQSIGPWTPSLPPRASEQLVGALIAGLAGHLGGQSQTRRIDLGSATPLRHLAVDRETRPIYIQRTVQ
jgi:hypothetical protein